MRRASYDRLSAHDAGYLARETAVQPMHFVLQLDVAGGLSLEEVRTHVAGRLALVPELRKMARFPLFAGRPVLVDDPGFDLARHVVAWPEPLADADEVFLALTLRRLPRDRPLWSLTVGAGPHGATTLWLCVHHAIMDGGLLIAVLNDLFPSTADDRAPKEWSPRRGPSRLALLVLVIARRVRAALRRPARGSGGAVVPPRPTRLTGTVSGRRALADLTVPLPSLREARRRTGATINDLFVAAVTEGMRQYLPSVPESLVALIPRNVRQQTQTRTMGNQAWSMLVSLPTGTDDSQQRLAAIRAATDEGKQAQSTAGTQGWRFDIALTNVALGGPHAVAGRPIRHQRVSVPLQGENRLVATATSHDDDFTITFTADAEAFPDIERLAALTRASLMATASATR